MFTLDACMISWVVLYVTQCTDTLGGSLGGVSLVVKVKINQN